ncbi:glycosyltransferase [Conexibacter woesei]|uniref:glycosyltransferase n=1 Tax=Conexibacter woesei TaxID=191495 RepID=UPI000421A4F7|nr:glycosyltransferase [Conexibacter woesei]
MPRLRRRDDEPPPPPPAAEPVLAAVPWPLADLLQSGPTPLSDRQRLGSAVTLVLPPGAATPRAAGVPPELLAALEGEGFALTTLTADEAEHALAAEVDPPAGSLADADVVLAAGWAAAPAVLMAEGVRARAVLPTADAPPLADLGWADGALPVLGPAWLGGELPAGADAAYVPKPVHRREDLVLVHGEEPFGLLAAAILAERRDDLTFAVTGVREDLALPFRFLGVEPGPEALAHAFASATVAIAPSVRGWRPAAVAMLACGQAVVAPDDAPTCSALGDAASYARGPLEAAAAVEDFLRDPDYALRAERARAGFALVPGGWADTAASLAAHLRAL